MLAAELHAQAGSRCMSGMSASTSYRPEPSHILQRHHRRPTHICHAKKGGDDPASKGKASGAGDTGKADFSAYWSLKVRNFFSERRNYLDKAEDKKEQRPKVFDWLDDEIAKNAEELARVQEIEAMNREPDAVRRARIERQAAERTQQILGPLQQSMLGQTLPLPPPPSEAAVLVDEARHTLVPSWTAAVSMSLWRAKQLLQAILMAPWTLLVAAYQAWQGLFKTQRYEMFLLSEGEKLWYWRNRMENERWFWEIFAWDRLIFPIICTVAYQYVVPNHLVWVVVVPVVFIAWQTGRIIGPGDLEFWLIAYFGVYKKCWADVVGFFMTLFYWA